MIWPPLLPLALIPALAWAHLLQRIRQDRADERADRLWGGVVRNIHNRSDI